MINSFSISFRSFKFLSVIRLYANLILLMFLFPSGFPEAAYHPFPTHPYSYPTTPVHPVHAAVTPHPGPTPAAHAAAYVPQTPNPYANHYAYAHTVGKK